MSTSNDAQSLVLVYTGNGKGKTTAALGLIFRALGRGWKIAVVQFIKGRETGEYAFAETQPDVDWHVMGLGFTWESDDLNKDKAAAQNAWEQAEEYIQGGEHNIVILDEITYAINYDFIQLDDVVNALKNRPKHVHVVLTGRDAPEVIVELADLVSEMNPIKHPFDKGIAAQKGVDF